RTSIAHDDPSGRGFDERVDHLEESRLTRAAGAQERQDLAPGHTEADSLDRLMVPGINLRDVIPDHGFRSRGRQLRHERWFPLESSQEAAPLVRSGAETQTPCWLLARPCTRPMSDGQIIKVAVHGIVRRACNRCIIP